MSKRCSILAPESHLRCQKSTMHLGPHEATDYDNLVTVWSHGLNSDDVKRTGSLMVDLDDGPNFAIGFEAGWEAALRWAGVV